VVLSAGEPPELSPAAFWAAAQPPDFLLAGSGCVKAASAQAG